MASRALADLESRQSGVLSALRDPSAAHSEMLTALMVSNSLLELSKLASARLSLIEFSQAALTALSQCAPIDSAALVFSAPELSPVRSTIGDWPEVDDESLLLTGGVATMPALRVCPVSGADPSQIIGYLGVDGAPAALLDAGLVERAADHLSSMLGMLIEAERLRRAAAASRAIELIGSLEDGYGEDDLYEIVSAIQTLPGAEAASILLEFPRFGGPLHVEAGVKREASEPTVCAHAIDRRGTLTLTVWWSGDCEPQGSRFREIDERLTASIGRAEQTIRLLEEVETDALTGIGNRRRASRALTQARARAQRNGEEFSVLMMDLDRFKSVNDELGHDVGDQVLCAFARAIEAAIRGYDVAARWGGEEFLVVCASSGLEGARSVAQRVLRETPEFCAPFLPPDKRQSVSIGIAVCQNPLLDPLEVVRAADAALYEAKTGGRDRYVLAPNRT